MSSVISPKQVAESLTELWSPRVIAEVDDVYIKVAKVHGSLTWHSHAQEDELFLVLKGRLRIELETGAVELGEGEMVVVRHGVRHNPVAEQECLVMLVERKSTLHTGDVMTEKTRSIEEQLRPTYRALCSTKERLTGKAWSEQRIRLYNARKANPIANPLMTTPDLTRRQASILEFVHERLRAGGTGPTVREIADRFEIQSPNGVTGHLRALKRKGFISRSPHKSRSITLSRQWTEQFRGLPMAGRVHAGAMHEAVEVSERVDFAAMFKKRGTYVLRVEGESMIDAHIADGDYVVIQPNKAASPGDIAVVQTDDGQATLKYWFPEKHRIRLQPANRRMKPLYVKRVRVLGVVVGVFRHL